MSGEIYPTIRTKIDKFRKLRQRIGYKHWFQNTLGNGLIKDGIKIATESLERETTAAAAAMSRSVQLASVIPDTTPTAPVTPSSTNMNRRSTRSNVLRNTTNYTEKRRAGRPSKRSRGRSGGRPKTAVCMWHFLPTFHHACHTHTPHVTHTLTKHTLSYRFRGSALLSLVLSLLIYQQVLHRRRPYYLIS